MNGAAMNCRPDPVLRSQHSDSRVFHDAGYHLQMNHPYEQNFLPHHSKAITSQSGQSLVESSTDYSQHAYTFDTTRPAAGDIHDPRSQVRWTQTRKPIDLPVPKFEVDENFVANQSTTDTANSNHENLDLDTRIDLLIKSKALAGMHPIFSELIESEDDSDDFLFSHPKNISMNKKRRSLSDETIVYQDKFDDPDKPLSRPPSPFLSRATYLFWFNKAIELKEQAKAQEQALLEKATKRLQENISSAKPSRVEKPVKENKTFFNCLLNEISKEMKEVIKEQFINEVLESTISNWWGTEFVQQEQNGNTYNDTLIPGSSEKVLSDSIRSTSPVDQFYSEKMVSENLKPEEGHSFNKTDEKHQHNLDSKRCDELVISDKSNITNSGENDSKQSLTTLTSPISHISNKSENKHEKLVLDKKQDNISTADVNSEQSKACVMGSNEVGLTLNTELLPENQTDTEVSFMTCTQDLDLVRQEPSNEQETSKSVVGNFATINEGHLNNSSLSGQEKHNIIRNHCSDLTNDTDSNVLNQVCQENKKESPVQNKENKDSKDEEYSNNLMIIKGDADVNKKNCEEKSVLTSQVESNEKHTGEIFLNTVDDQLIRSQKT